MTINQLKAMTKREYGLWFSNAKTSDLKELLNNENKGGGISKFSKANLISVVMDLVDGVETELTKQLKPKREIKKVHIEEERMFKELMKKENTQTLMVFPPVYSQMNYFYYKKDVGKKEYYKLSKYFHPDNKETGNEEKFKIITEAYNNAKKEHQDMDKIKNGTDDELFNEFMNKIRKDV